MGEEADQSREALIYRDEVFRIQGVVFEVSRNMGIGFLEAVYQECLAIEFAARDVPFVTGQGLELSYKGVPLKQT